MKSLLSITSGIAVCTMLLAMPANAQLLSVGVGANTGYTYPAQEYSYSYPTYSYPTYVAPTYTYPAASYYPASYTTTYSYPAYSYQSSGPGVSLSLF